MEFSKRKIVFVMILCLSFQSVVNSSVTTSTIISSNSCVPELKTFLHDLKSQCPFSAFPIQVSGETFEKAMSSIQKNEYAAVLFYASWCPFSSIFQSKFSALSSMYPQIKHLMVEQSSAMPSIFSRYGVHSVPSLLMVSQTAQTRHYGQKDLQSLVNFYKQTTAIDPIIDMVEARSNDSENEPKILQLWGGASVKETFSKEPYLVLSIIFVFLRAFLHFLPQIKYRLTSFWVTYAPHLNLGIFGESRQILGCLLHLIDVKRLWSKLKLFKTRNFHQGARNAQVWASSLASVSLGKASSSRIFPSSDL